MDATTQSAADVFEITRFLAGHTEAWGVFEDRFGRLKRRLHVQMHGYWEGGVFVLDERFAYDTGKVETRRWTVVPGRDAHFTATSPDCVGTARGSCTKDAISMAYRFRLKLNARTLEVNFNDRIYDMGAGLAVNRATMSKWGVRLGELSLFFRRCDGDNSAA